VGVKRLKKYEGSEMSKFKLRSCQGTDLAGGKYNVVKEGLGKKI
jgi:hypothetical protein